MTRFAALSLAVLLAACSSTTIVPPVMDASADRGAADASRPSDAPAAADAPGEAGSCAVGPATAPDLVATDRGLLRGTVEGGVRSFKGVPFAAPPVGGLRWRPPQPPACATATVDATRFGSSCPQLDATGAVTGAEDCLTLNVWAPATPPSAPLPVMFFVHGGGNFQGSTSQTTLAGARIYDGARLAAQEHVVVVTANYRLGALGFLGHPALTAESDRHASGNYGLLDQIAALHWVQANVAAFGGDPSRVLVFGESAGGVDACALLASPLSAGLFSRALIESGGCTAQPLATTEAQGTMLAQATSCATASDALGCLRALPAADVVRALPGASALTPMIAGVHYQLTVDHVALDDTPANVIAAGRHHAMPVVVGTNRDEFAYFFPPTGGRGMMTDAQYRALVSMEFRAAAPVVLAFYPSGMFPSPYFAYVDLVSDALFTCPARGIARSLAASGQPVRRYFFSHSDPGAASAYGAAHAFELSYVFGNFGGAPDGDQQVLNGAMMGYWSRFAATGDPNGAGAPAWPAFTVAGDEYLELGATVSAGAGLHTLRCNAWDRVTP